jgi:hypothetical protein
VASFSGRYGCARSPKAVPHAVPQAGVCTASRRQPQEKNRGGGTLGFGIKSSLRPWA